MASYNRVIIAGNLTREPDYKQLSSGQAVCRLGIASNRQFKNRQTNAMVQEVCYIDVDVWGPQAESCKQYLQKGRPVLVEGRLKLDSWEDANGQARSRHSIVADRIVFLGAPNAAVHDESMRAESDESTSVMAGPRLDPGNAKEREILSQIEQLKTKKVAPAKKSSPKKDTDSNAAETSGGEISFKDEQPFQDDLPF